MTFAPPILRIWGHFEGVLALKSGVLPRGRMGPSWVTFLALTGAQGVTMSVCLSVRLSVCPAQSVQEQSIFIFLAQIFKLT